MELIFGGTEKLKGWEPPMYSIYLEPLINTSYFYHFSLIFRYWFRDMFWYRCVMVFGVRIGTIVDGAEI